MKYQALFIIIFLIVCRGSNLFDCGDGTGTCTTTSPASGSWKVALDLAETKTSNQVSSSAHRFACGIKKTDNKECGGGGLTSHIEVIWCQENDNWARSTSSQSSWTVSNPGGQYNEQTLMCDPGQLMDGFDAVSSYENINTLGYCASYGQECSCSTWVYYGAVCQGVLDQAQNYWIISATCSNEDYGDPLPGVYKQCWCGSLANNPLYHGLKNVGIRCSPQYDKTKTSPIWKYSNDWPIISAAKVSHIVYHDDQFICGFDFKTTSSGLQIQTFVGVDVQYCEVVRCEDKLTAIANPDFTILIEPGHGGSYGDNTQSRAIFNNYMQNIDTSGFCNILTCQLLSSVCSQNLYDVNFAWVDTQNIYLNQDPTQEYLYPSVCLRCQNRNITITTNTFKLQASCTSNTDISLPLDLIQDQTCYASNYTGARSKFNFTSFQTLTSACQVTKYQIYQGVNSLKAPNEFRVTTFEETYNIGQNNTGSFYIEVMDGENPYQYSFIMYAEAMGGSTYTSPTFTLTTKCPDHVTYDFYQSGFSLFTVSSYVGADTAGDGSGASFNFPTWFPYLSKCTQVLYYEVVDVSPANSVTYPSQNFCLSDKCPVVDFDVSTAQTLNFKLRVTHSQGVALSEQYSIVVAQDYQSPTITIPTMSFVKNILVDQNDKFQFDPFICSSGCQVTNYQVSSSSSSITPISGLSVSLNSATGKMEVTLADTSFLQSVGFYIYAQLQSSPSISAFSNQITLNVVCGSEQISFTQSSLTVTPYQQGQGIKTYLLSEAIQAMVASDKTVCPITGYSIANMDSRVTFSVDRFTINTASSYVVNEQLTVSTAGVSKILPVTFVVCGNEVFLSGSQTIKMIVPKNEGFTISKSTYLNYFTLYYLQSSSHQECIETEILSNLLKDDSCSGTLNSEVHYSISTGGDIVFDTSYPFKMRSMCLNLQTKINKKVQSQILEIEVMGSEIVTLVDSKDRKEISKVFAFDKTGKEVISVSSTEGFSFTTDSVNAPVTSYKLMLKNSNGQYTEYTDSQVTVDSSLNVKVLTNEAIIKTFYLQASTQSSAHMAYLPISIKVCGLETINPRRSTNIMYYSKTSIINRLTKKNLQKYFDVSDPDCPFNQYSIDSDSDYNDTYVSISSQEDLEFYPSLSSLNPADDTFTLKIIGQTLGLIQTTLNLDIVFLSPSSSSTSLLLLQAPAFVTEPQPYKFHLFIGDQLERAVTYASIVLPEIVDPKDEEIVEIDKSWQLFKNGDKIEMPQWLSLQGGVIKIRWEDPEKLLPVVQKEDQANYTMKFKLENVLGQSRDEQIEFELLITKSNTHELLKLSLDKLEDIYFQIRIRDPSDCIPEGMSFIQSFETFCDTSKSGDIFNFCQQVLQDCFILFYPEISDKPANDQQAIHDVHIKFVSEIFHSKNEEWLKNDGKLFNRAGIMEIMSTTLQYDIKGKKFQSNGQDCGLSVPFYNSNVQENTPDELKTLLNDKKEQKVNENKKVEVQRKVKQQVSLNNDTKFFQDLTDLNTYFEIQFDKDIKEWNELEKKGVAKYINLQMKSGYDSSIVKGIYQSSVEQRELEEEEDEDEDSDSLSKQNLNFVWKFNETQQSANSSTLLLIFQDNSRVSQNIYGKRDSLLFWIEPNNYIRDKEYNLAMNKSSFGSFTKKMTRELRPLRVKDLSPLVSEQVITRTLILVLIVQAQTFILNTLLDKSLQDIWALFSTQIITYHLMLFTVSSSVPSNIMLFNTYVSDFVQRDMYQTDEIFAYVFGEFSESESIREQFEDLGYEGSNFLELTGSLIINLVIILISRILVYIAMPVIKRFSHVEYARRLGIWMQSTQGWATIFEIYLQGYLELFMCAVISFKGTFEQDLFETGGDKFSVIFMYISLTILFFLPLGISRFIYKNKDKLNDPEFAEQYGFIFSELSTRTPEKAIFNLIYMIRRIIFVLIIVFMNNYCYFQIISHTILTITYAGYILAFKPYLDNETNKIQAFNEISVLLTTYVLITLTDPNISSDQRYNFGYFYILSSGFNIFYNLYRIINELVQETIPQIWQKYKLKKENEEYEKQIQRWLKIKAKNAKKSRVDLEIYLHAKLIVKIREQKRELGQRLEDYHGQKKWLVENEIPGQKMNQMAKEIQSLKDVLRSNMIQVDKENKSSGIRWGQHFGGLNAILYSTKVVGSSNLYIFHHNTGKKSPPFSFRVLQNTVVNPFHLLHGQNLPGYLQDQLEQRVKEDNQRRLNKYLEKNGYYVMEMKADGNCGPRAIATRVFGTQKKHHRARHEICQYVSCQPKYWGAQRGIPNYQEFIKKKLKKRGEWFSDTELRAAAKFYNFPIIIFSGQYSTPFFDLINEALTFEGNNQEPLYIHHLNGSHFNFLAHKKQLEFYNHLNLVPFIASNFDVRPMVFLDPQISLQNKVQQKYKQELKINKFTKNIVNRQWNNDLTYLETIQEEIEGENPVVEGDPVNILFDQNPVNIEFDQNPLNIQSYEKIEFEETADIEMQSKAKVSIYGESKINLSDKTPEDSEVLDLIKKC